MACPTHCSRQSSGALSIPQTFPDSFRASPKSQRCSNSPSEMQLTTRAATSAPVGRPLRYTTVPGGTGRGERTAHPPRLARMTWHGCEKRWPGSRPVSVTGISQGMRVPPRRTFSGLEPKVAKRKVLTEFCRIERGTNFCSGFVTNVRVPTFAERMGGPLKASFALVGMFSKLR